jgi:hypothetical protein
MYERGILAWGLSRKNLICDHDASKDLNKLDTILQEVIGNYWYSMVWLAKRVRGVQ